MTSLRSAPQVRSLNRISVALLAIGTTASLVALAGFAGSPASAASQPTVGLGKADPFAILSGQTVTNTGASTISGSLGLSPGTAVTGFPPGHVHNGAIHAADAVALQAKNALTTAYLDAAGRTPGTTVGNLGGRNLSPGVYKVAAGMSLTGTVTLNAHGDRGAVFIFQAGSTLTAASNSTVRLTGGAQACHVFWKVGSSATLRTNSTFVGTILALTSASLQTGAKVSGRVLARNGSVTLDDNTITRPTSCLTGRVAGSPSPSPSASASASSSTPASPAGPAGSIAAPVIPKGPPDTGTEGSSASSGGPFLLLGVTALIGGLLAMTQAARVRRLNLIPGRHGRSG